MEFLYSYPPNRYSADAWSSQASENEVKNLMGKELEN